MGDQKSKWCSVLKTDQEIEEIFSPTLATAKKAIIDWLQQKNPTCIEIGGDFPFVYHKIGPSHWVATPQNDLLPPQNDNLSFYESIVPMIFTQTGPAHIEMLIDQKDQRICLERVKTLSKQSNSMLVNLMFWRGWHLLSIEIVQGTTFFVLGHHEYDAF